MKKIFISGSITIKNLNEQIKIRLDNIINQNHMVLIGDAKGADTVVQSYFAKNEYPHVIIYCSGQTCRNNIGDWSVENVQVPPKARGRQFYIIKDEQMAIDSDYGFMIWDGKSAGTINNLFNLVTHGKTGVLYLQPQKAFRTIKNSEEFETFISECDPKNIEEIDKKIAFRKKLKNYNLPAQEEFAFSSASGEPEVIYSSRDEDNEEEK